MSINGKNYHKGANLGLASFFKSILPGGKVILRYSFRREVTIMHIWQNPPYLPLFTAGKLLEFLLK